MLAQLLGMGRGKKDKDKEREKEPANDDPKGAGNGRTHETAAQLLNGSFTSGERALFLWAQGCLTSIFVPFFVLQ